MIRLQYILVYIYYHILSHVVFLLSLVFFYIVWCILPRYFWCRFLVLLSISLTWSCLVDGEIEIHCTSLQGILNLDQLHQGFQQMEIFYSRGLRYLLPLDLVFWKLRRQSGQPAESKAEAYDACFEGVRDIGTLFKGLQQMGRVRKGRFGRSRFSCRSHGLCPPPAVSSTVIKLGVCHQMRFSASHIRKETLEVTHLKKLAERTGFGNLLQLRRMFVHAFSGFSGGSELC